MEPTKNHELSNYSNWSSFERIFFYKNGIIILWKGVIENAK